MTWLFERFPFLEILTRIVYKKALEWGILKKRVVPNEKAQKVETTDIEMLTEILRKNGVFRGDVLIVHSSMKGIRGFGKSPTEIIEYLKEIVGEEGMLMMPAYPDYPKRVVPAVFDERYEEIFEYNVEETPAWTGLITNIFMKGNDVIRSHFPNNPLAAWGKNKEVPFADEMGSDLAYGRNSAWNYCVEHHAKVLFLGIHAHHSMSEIHIAEDFLDDSFPVKGWYTKKRTKVISGSKEILKESRVRKLFWAKYMTEYNGCYRLRKQGVLIEGKIGNINYSIIPDLNDLVSYVLKQALKGDLLYFRIPRKYRKSHKGDGTGFKKK